MKKLLHLLSNSTIFGGFLLLLLYLSTKASSESSTIYHIIVFVPLAVICGVSLNRRNLLHKAWSDNLWIILFVTFYNLLYWYNNENYSRSFSYIVVYVSFILIAYWIFSKKKSINITDITVAIFAIGIFAVMIPSYRIVGSLTLGSYYNLTHSSLLTTTTLDDPMLIALLFLFACYDLLFNKKYTVLNITAILFSFFVLLLFSRRGIIFSSLIGLFLYYLCVKFKKRFFIYIPSLFLILPIFWTLASGLLLEVSNSEVYTSIISRNNRDDLVTATGRMASWEKITSLFFSFQPEYFFGIFGGPSKNLFISTIENNRFLHAHNTFLQLFLDGGYFLIFVFLIMIFKSLNRYYKYLRSFKNVENMYFPVIIFFFVLCGTETMFRGLQFSNFLFLYFFIAFMEETRKRQYQIFQVELNYNIQNNK